MKHLSFYFKSVKLTLSTSYRFCIIRRVTFSAMKIETNFHTYYFFSYIKKRIKTKGEHLEADKNNKHSNKNAF